MTTYGKLTNNQLITPDSIPLGRGQFITNPTDEEYIDHGYKEVIDIKPSFANYDKSYTELETQIVVSYIEVPIPEMAWHEDTNFQIKFTEKQLRYLFLEVPAMVMDFKSLEDYEDMIGNIYFYVNELSDEDRQLIENFGGIITERRAE